MTDWCLKKKQTKKNPKSVSWMHILRLFLQVTFILNHKKIKNTFCWTRALSSTLRLFRKRGVDTFTERSQGLPSRKLVWWQYTDLSGKLAAPLDIRDWLSLTSAFFVCVGGILWVMVSLSSLIEFEGASRLLHKMDFANSRLRHTQRKRASRFINGNSRQTTEVKDTSACKRFQMETSFSLHSPQFSC